MNKKVLFVYPRFERHADANPELRQFVPMNEYMGSPSLGLASLAAMMPTGWEVEYRDDRITPADASTDADLVALSFFTPAATRGMQLADFFRAQGKTVVAGGIFPTAMPEIVAPHVDAVVIGESETTWPSVLADHLAGALRPVYGPIIADLDHAPVPKLDMYFAAETPQARMDDYPLQISRGCPLTCSACMLPTSMGNRMRTFPLAHVLAQLDQLTSAGKLACLTEDTSWFVGAPGWTRMSELFDVLADRPAPISYVGISMPMILTIPSAALQRARRAGVKMFYLVGGFDPITTRAFTGKDPRAYTRAVDVIRKCNDNGIDPYTSFLYGLDDDDEGTVDRILSFCEEAGVH